MAHYKASVIGIQTASEEISLSANISPSFNTTDIDAVIFGLSASISAAFNTTSISATTDTPLSASLKGSFSTTDIVAGIGISLASTLSGAFSTSDINTGINIQLAASTSAGFATTGINATINVYPSVSLSGAFSTSDIVAGITQELSAISSGTFSTTNINTSLGHTLAATLSGTFNTSDICASMPITLTAILSGVFNTSNINAQEVEPVALYEYNPTIRQIISEAIELAGIARVGQSLPTEQYLTGLTSLNMMVKGWIADQIGLWLEKRIYAIPGRDSKITYFGPNCETSRVTDEYWQRELHVDATASTTIYLDSITDLSVGDNIGAELDDQTMSWTTISVINTVVNANGGYEVTLASALPSVSAAGNYAFIYTDDFEIRPTEIIQVSRVQADGTEYDIPIVSRNEYDLINNKETIGSVNQCYYHNTIPKGQLFLWETGSTARERLSMTVKIPFRTIEYEESPGSSWAEFPQEWLETISLNLAVRLMLKNRMTMTGDKEEKMLYFQQYNDLKNMAEESLWDLKAYDRENTSVYFQPVNTYR